MTCAAPTRPDPIATRAAVASKDCLDHAAHCQPALARTLARAGLDASRLHCNTLVRWEPSLAQYATRTTDGIAKLWNVTPADKERKRALHHALGYLVRSYFDQVQPQNLGAAQVRDLYYTDAAGRRQPVLLFRSAVITAPSGKSQCFQSLLETARVRHVINLYGGSFPFRDVIESEQALAKQRGASYFDAAKHPELAYRPLVEQAEHYDQHRAQAMQNLARLIREHLLAPEGQPPKGNLYIHCGGGMHRSGMLFGVIQRCINKVPMPEIEREYKRHTGYISSAEPGGFEPLNLRFIREFDCALLTHKVPAR